LNASVSQLLKLVGQPIQFQLGPKWYAEGPTGAPDWGIRFAVTLLFPKR
jgi:hypothetical protein